MALKKDKRKSKYIFLIVLFLVVIFSSFSYINDVEAAVNKLYPNDENVLTDLTKTTDNALLNAIGRLAYIVAKMLEFFISKIMSLITNENVFPWADKVVFNTIPFLDVNFINPATGSLFEDPDKKVTAIGSIVGNMYYTIFVIAMAFLGVAVGIMAIRLAISTIASEKAKYKEAIQNWLLAIVLMFTTHYLISFIFFVNEKMVEVASTILTDKIQNINIRDISYGVLEYDIGDINTALTALKTNYMNTGASIFDGGVDGVDSWRMIIEFKVANETYTLHFIPTHLIAETNNGNAATQGSCVLYKNPKYVYSVDDVSYTPLSCSEKNPSFEGGIPFLKKEVEGKCQDQDIIICDEGINKKASEVFDRYTLLLMLEPSFADAIGLEGDEYDDNKELYKLALEAAILTVNDNEVLDKLVNNKINNADNIAVNITNTRNYIFYTDTRYWESGQSMGNEKNMSLYYTPSSISSLNNILARVWKKKHGATGVSNMNTHDFIGNMGEFFRESAYGYNVIQEGEDAGKLVNYTGSKTKFQPVGAILYAIFVFMSVTFFIAYIKRLFYVVMLALFAPLVIMYDFIFKIVGS